MNETVISMSSHRDAAGACAPTAENEGVNE
ncbi:MAG: hypothetical protein JWN46_1788 [Acidimicrobiales bacterium]|nr:hypothetical protein [Acidimicrobiales bacterium]